MSINQTFPDVIVMSDGRIQMVTIWGKTWVREYTENNFESYKEVPDIIEHDVGDLQGMAQAMHMDGLIVRWKRPN